MKTNKVNQIGFDIKPFHDMVVFDLETTGLSPANDEIIQIAAIRMIQGQIIEDDFFFSYVKPARPIPSFITSYTGVTERDVEKAPSTKKALFDFSVYCRDSLLAAHNGTRFDVPFVTRSCERNSMKTRSTHSIDSMHLSWDLWGRAKGVSHSLDNVISRLDVPQDDIRRHDARGDVMVTARCIQKMVAQIKEQSREVALKIHTCVIPEIKT
jgi:DNA polymerase III epsilon subunit family exonuclease